MYSVTPFFNFSGPGASLQHLRPIRAISRGNFFPPVWERLRRQTWLLSPFSNTG